MYILDMGYSADGTYQIALIGKVKTEESTSSSAEANASSPKIGLPQRISNSIGMEFVHVKSGSFMMGTPASEQGQVWYAKRHRVTLTKGFYMQTTEVTQEQWMSVMGNNPSKFVDCGVDCPVERVSWNDVQIFISKLNRKEGRNKYRLPSEAEWEYAARAGSTTTYFFGNDSNYLSQYAWYKNNSKKRTNSVGQTNPNDWEIYGMHGNVQEWCKDYWKKDFPSGSVTDPTGPSNSRFRVLRGGTWASHPDLCRSVARDFNHPEVRNHLSGFRLVREP